MSAPVAFWITLGAGKDKPQGRREFVSEKPDAAALVKVLELLPTGETEGWWSPHVFRQDYRRQRDWVGAAAVAQDLDYYSDKGNHVKLPDRILSRLDELWACLPSCLWHPTPRGVRLVAVLDRFETDAATYEKAARGMARGVAARLADAGLLATKRQIVRRTPQRGERSVVRPCGGLWVDESVIADRARFLYSPSACVDGVDRVGSVQLVSERTWTPDAFASLPGHSAEARPDSERSRIEDAVARFNAANVSDWPKSGGKCPACGHDGCFGRLPGTTGRWSCFSDNHESDSNACGIRGAKVWHGDALDLAAHDAGLDRLDLLRRDGLLDGAARSAPASGESRPTQQRRWPLQAGEYEVIAWPTRDRPLSVTLEFLVEGLRVLRDNVNLNSRRSRGTFAREAAKAVPAGPDDAESTIANDLRDLIGLVEQLDPAYQVGSGENAASMADLLVELAAEAELFHDRSDRAFARIEMEGHFEIWPIRSTRFRNWLRRQHRRKHGNVPNSQALNDAIGVLEGLAQIDGPCVEVHVRVGSANDKIYVDICDRAWQAVEIDADGWRIVKAPPVRFVRAPGMEPLPQPVEGGSLDGLRRFFNLRDEDDAILLKAWLVAALRPDRPFPVIVIYGEQGSAKSTAEKVLRALVDPNRAPLRSPPRSEHDLVIAARNSWMIALDNLSTVPPWLSDALCRISTGSGFSTRRLYSDDEEEIFAACRPIAINGIDEVATRGDLVDRSITLFLLRIDETKRRDEQSFWEEFELARPALLGAIYSALSLALRRLPEVDATGLPRLADFAKIAMAAEPAFGCAKGGFMSAYRGNYVTALVDHLEHSPVAGAIVRFTKSLPNGFHGTATELLDKLGESAGDNLTKRREWPHAPNILSNLLRRLAPSLRLAGLAVEFEQTHGGGSSKRIRLGMQKTDAIDAADAPGSAGVDGVDCVDDPQDESHGGSDTTGGRAVDDLPGLNREPEDGEGPSDPPAGPRRREVI